MKGENTMRRKTKEQMMIELDELIEQLEKQEAEASRYVLDLDERCWFEEVLDLAHGTN